MLKNLALGKIVSNMQDAKSATDGDIVKYDANKGFGHCNWPNNVKLDLEDVYQLETIRLYLWDKDNRYYHYQVFISEDGESWNLVKNNATIQSRGLQVVKLSSEKTRFIKVKCLYNSKNLGFHIVQLEVFGMYEHEKRDKRFPVPMGHEFITPVLENFKKDHPDYDKNVFIMMNFRDYSPFTEIESAIRSALAKNGYCGLRADDKIYPEDRDLWTNVCSYMLGCKYGIAVFGKLSENEEYSPNVELEYGFMRAMNKNVILLKSKDRKALTSDIVGKIYHEFDSANIIPSIEKQISKWVKEIQYL